MLKFAPKEKASNRVAQLDDAGQAIVAQIRTAADLAKEDCDRAMSLAHKLSMELRAADTGHSKKRGRLSTGETDQPAPNNGFGRSSKRLKRSCSLADHPPAAAKPPSVSLNQKSSARFIKLRAIDYQAASSSSECEGHRLISFHSRWSPIWAAARKGDADVVRCSSNRLKGVEKATSVASKASAGAIDSIPHDAPTRLGPAHEAEEPSALR